MSWWKKLWRCDSNKVNMELARERALTEQSVRDLNKTRARTPEIQALSDHMVALKVRNHFGDALVLAMMAKGPKP